MEVTDIVRPISIHSGYVAFDDSFAAGIGAGSTEGNGCRKDQNSYPEQLAALAAGTIDFQNLACSGAVAANILGGGKGSQVDAWRNARTADVATLSIGGNDVGFYDVLTACVLRVGQFRSGDCDRQIQKAYRIINGPRLSNDIESITHQILGKSGLEDLKVFQTSYAAFFNVDADSCDYTTLYYWQPDFNEAQDRAWK